MKLKTLSRNLFAVCLAIVVLAAFAVTLWMGPLSARVYAAGHSEFSHVASNTLYKFKTSSDSPPPYSCGGGPKADQVQISIDIGCIHRGNPIVDAAFAIIRLLSDGVGLVVIGSIVYAGIQYSSSRGDPQATAAAITRIRSAITALLIFIFGYAILNYIIPVGFLHS